MRLRGHICAAATLIIFQKDAPFIRTLSPKEWTVWISRDIWSDANSNHGHVCNPCAEITMEQLKYLSFFRWMTLSNFAIISAIILLVFPPLMIQTAAGSNCLAIGSRASWNAGSLEHTRSGGSTKLNLLSRRAYFSFLSREASCLSLAQQPEQAPPEPYKTMINHIP